MKLFFLNMLDEWINGFYPRISFSVGGSKTSTKSSQEVNRNTEAELLGVSTGTQATKSKTAKEEATDTDKSTKAVSTAEQTSQTQQQVQSIAQLLDTETQDLIKSLVGQLSQDIGGNDEADLLSSLLSERSQTAEGDVLAQIGPIIANAPCNSSVCLSRAPIFSFASKSANCVSSPARPSAVAVTTPVFANEPPAC